MFFPEALATNAREEPYRRRRFNCLCERCLADARSGCRQSYRRHCIGYQRREQQHKRRARALHHHGGWSQSFCLPFYSCVAVLTLTRIIKSVVTGLAPLNLEWVHTQEKRRCFFWLFEREVFSWRRYRIMRACQLWYTSSLSRSFPRSGCKQPLALLNGCLHFMAVQKMPPVFSESVGTGRW